MRRFVLQAADRLTPTQVPEAKAGFQLHMEGYAADIKTVLFLPMVRAPFECLVCLSRCAQGRKYFRQHLMTEYAEENIDVSTESHAALV